MFRSRHNSSILFGIVLYCYYSSVLVIIHLYCWLLFCIVSIVCIVTLQYSKNYLNNENFDSKQQSKIGHNTHNIGKNIVTLSIFCRKWQQCKFWLTKNYFSLAGQGLFYCFKNHIIEILVATGDKNQNNGTRNYLPGECGNS